MSVTGNPLYDSNPGTVHHDRVQGPVRVQIVSGPFGPCVYLGLPLDHPLAGTSYSALNLDVHGGLTYGRAGEGGESRPADRWWWGWDYAHLGDLTIGEGLHYPGRERYLVELIDHSAHAAAQLIVLIGEAEGGAA